MSTYTNIRMDTITSIDLKSRKYTYLANGTLRQTVFSIPTDKAIEIDSIYIHSNESTTTCIARLSVNTTNNLNYPGRSFFVARMAPKETCLAVSKSTPLFMEDGQALIVEFFNEDHSTGTPLFTCTVVVSYREYGI